MPAHIELGLLAEVLEIRHGRNYGWVDVGGHSPFGLRPMRPTATRRACPAARRALSMPRRLGQFGNAQRLAEAAAAIQRIAVLAMPRGVLRGGQQQAAAVRDCGSCRSPRACRARFPGCADRCRAASRPSPARAPAAPCRGRCRDRPGPSRRALGASRAMQRGLDARRHVARRRGRRRSPASRCCGGVQIAGQLLVPGGLVEIGGGEIEQLQPLRMLELVPEPAQRVAVLVAMLRQGEVEFVVRLEHDLGDADLDRVEDRRAGSCRPSAAPSGAAR